MTDIDPPGSASGEQIDAVVTRLAADLDAGFVDLVRAYERVVYSVALRVSGSADAEDLAAESFLRAYRALLRYDQDRIRALRPRPWLLTIVLNTWRNSVRDSSRRPSQVPLSEATDLPGSEPSVEEMAERAEVRRGLAGMVAELPPQQRAAVVLRHVIGLPIAEVAAVLGCPDGTAKSHVSRGLRRLRTLCQVAGVDVDSPVPRAPRGGTAPPGPVNSRQSRHPDAAALVARRER